MIEFALTSVSLLIWLYLLCFRGQFWLSDQLLDDSTTELTDFPSVCVVIPARNEAELLPITLKSLLSQNYPGSWQVILVDDSSTDNTATIAENIATELNKTAQLHVISGKPLPPGWTGKLWAMQQGIEYASNLQPLSKYLLLSDADIVHDSFNLSRLVTKAETKKLDLVSLMVRLRCESFWEKLLIPAFVFFFEKLYPFRWVNNPQNSTAAAAGGCILIRQDTLARIGGIEVVRNALIDDCALAKVVKVGKSGNHQQLAFNTLTNSQQKKEQQALQNHESLITNHQKGKIWLGLSEKTASLRAYLSLNSIWSMVTRTAFTQLNYSFLLLLGTVFGMILIYLVPLWGVIWGIITGNELVAIAAFSTFLLMSVAYFPTIRFYRLSPLWAFSLPIIAFLYTLMTIDSALRYWQGRGGGWKGRVYAQIK